MQQEFDLGPLPNLNDLDGKKTQAAIEAVFEKYLFYKSITFEEREASTTASYSDIPRSYTGTTSDQTGSIAMYNVDEPERRRIFMDKVRAGVRKLPVTERTLIDFRYMQDEYKRDLDVFQTDMPMGKNRYMEIRLRAFYRLAFIFHDFRLLQVKDLTRNH
ncbi:ArpU family phage packaging/lysis transcriptional regulator [Paenibacillus humicus]|uniref:ArpU family phage packaging/lysis transcriptional regulator n=1 Tax=Paenibacillus humicus TaxID=412861 RepID=UPI001FE866EB|nr:ArpU family phage packaging/lysis transcriptional regulator [Paenibacillus humicus]